MSSDADVTVVLVADDDRVVDGDREGSAVDVEGRGRVVEATEAVAVLEAAGARVETVGVPDDGAAPAIPATASCVVCPYELEGTDGVAVLRALRERGTETPFVLYAADGDEAVASAAIQAGVTDYVPVSDGLSEAVAERAVAAARSFAAESRTTDVAAAARERALSEAYAVVADADRPFQDQVTDLLGVVQDALGTEYATLSYVDGDEYTFEAVGAPEGDPLSAGDTTSLSETNCERVVSTEQTVVLNDVERDAPELADRAGNAEWGISCYVGAPVMVDGDAYGTFCFYGREPREEAFSDWQVTFVDLFSDWVSYELERQRYIDRLTALNDLHSVVRSVTDAVMHRSERDAIERAAVDRLAATDSYSLAWVDVRGDEESVGDETGFETTAVGSGAGVEAPVAVGDVVAVADETEPSLRADRDGSVVVVKPDGESDRGSALADSGFERWAAVPMAFEDECFGVLHVATRRRDGLGDRERTVLGQVGEIVGLAIATVERKRTLAHERERLEFVNRFIRHNLLNSLNVVEARTGILDSHVPEAGREHLDVVQERTTDMIELIETLRTLMQAFSADDEREVQPVDLCRVLTSEVESARAAFSAASFRTELPAASVTVLADDLLPEVFENLLVNAVQHNDDPAPTVAVSVTSNAETATVHVADDGPGIAESILPSVFEKGERGFESPGTGFGLYLVREIVDAYDGEVAVESEEGEGTTFSVTLPRE